MWEIIKATALLFCLERRYTMAGRTTPPARTRRGDVSEIIFRDKSCRYNDAERFLRLECFVLLLLLSSAKLLKVLNLLF